MLNNLFNKKIVIDFLYLFISVVIQVITLIHTVLTCPETKTQTVLICCPKNTVLNWINEFSLWINSDMENICIFNPTK